MTKFWSDWKKHSFLIFSSQSSILIFRSVTIQNTSFILILTKLSFLSFGNSPSDLKWWLSLTASRLGLIYSDDFFVARVSSHHLCKQILSTWSKFCRWLPCCLSRCAVWKFRLCQYVSFNQSLLLFRKSYNLKRSRCQVRIYVSVIFTRLEPNY